MDTIVMNNKDEILMSLVHYFVTEKDYTPIVVKGVKDEIWLENTEGPYRIIRINCNYIHNDEQFNFDIFKTSYKKLIELIRSYYPDAVIYVQSTLPVAPKAEKRTDAVYNNEAASIFRTYEMEICEELSGQKVYYLDVASIMTGEDGYLLDDVSLDGVHPSLKYTNLWYEFLKEHAIDEERSV